MKTYSMKCTCGHVMTVQADSKEAAAQKLKEMMNQSALDAHWADKHQTDQNSKPTLEQSHAMIDQVVVEGDLSAAA